MRMLIVGFFSIFLVIGCKEEKGRETNMVNYKMKTYCVGRNFISMPASFGASNISTGIFKLTGSGPQDPAFEVIAHAGKFTHHKFVAEVAKRRLEMKRGGDEQVNVLRLEKELADGSILLRLQEIEDAYVSEVNFLRGENMVTVRSNSYDNQFLEVEENLIRFAAGVKEITPERNKPGFCLGPVEITGNFATERGSFWFRNREAADFEIDIDSYIPDDKIPLLERMARPDSLLSTFDIKHKVLRARKRRAGGMQAQEWLGWAKISDAPDAKNLKFALETMRPNPGPAAPSITVTFNTGKAQDDGTPTKTLISDDEAIQLWDAVVESIRPAGI